MAKQLQYGIRRFVLVVALVLIQGLLVYGQSQSEDGISGVQQSTFEFNTSQNDKPSDFELGQNYPNPFNPTTTISYFLTESGNVELTVYDMLGRKVRTLVNEEKQDGYHKVRFDASQLPSGVYVYLLRTDAKKELRKMTLLK